MQAVSPEFLAALEGSYEPVVRVDAWYDGDLVSPPTGLVLDGGQVEYAADRTIRGHASLIVASRDGSWGGASATTPLYGARAQVFAGLKLASGSEMVSLGWFLLTDADTTERWRPVVRPAEPGSTYTVSLGLSANAEFDDLMAFVAADRFIGRTQPAAATVFPEIAGLLAGSPVGWLAPTAVADKPVPAGVTYDLDRLAAIVALADVVDCDPVMTPDGLLTLQSRTPGAPVWAPVMQAADMHRGVTLEGLYNGVVALGQTAEDVQIQSQVATVDDGPMRWGGPLYHRPFFYSSPLIDTQAKADAAAITRLATLISDQRLAIQLVLPWNPALQLGDVITLPSPYAPIPALVTSITLPILPSAMTVTVTVDPALLMVRGG